MTGREAFTQRAKKWAKLAKLRSQKGHIGLIKGYDRIVFRGRKVQTNGAR